MIEHRIKKYRKHSLVPVIIRTFATAEVALCQGTEVSDIFVNCLRLATKEEIDDMVAAKGFRDNWNGEGVNYVSDRLALEDMHPANVFIDTITGKPICIDCIVKFVNPQI